jgi:hypothetical protein
MVRTTQPQALALVILFPVVSTVVVALREFARITIKQFSWGEIPQDLKGQTPGEQR